uniref:Paired domain-containing protein n=1 Tax=Panagrellus redivivus TaxID=6233 RepID=A0A7E4ZQB9_PANRE
MPSMMPNPLMQTIPIIPPPQIQALQMQMSSWACNQRITAFQRLNGSMDFRLQHPGIIRRSAERDTPELSDHAGDVEWHVYLCSCTDNGGDELVGQTRASIL